MPTKRLVVRKGSKGLVGWVGRRDLPVGQFDATGQLELRACLVARPRRDVLLSRRVKERLVVPRNSPCLVAQKGPKRLVVFRLVRETRRSEKRLVPSRSDSTKELDV